MSDRIDGSTEVEGTRVQDGMAEIASHLQPFHNLERRFQVFENAMTELTEVKNTNRQILADNKILNDKITELEKQNVTILKDNQSVNELVAALKAELNNSQLKSMEALVRKLRSDPKFKAELRATMAGLMEQWPEISESLGEEWFTKNLEKLTPDYLKANPQILVDFLSKNGTEAERVVKKLSKLNPEFGKIVHDEYEKNHASSDGNSGGSKTQDRLKFAGLILLFVLGGGAAVGAAVGAAACVGLGANLAIGMCVGGAVGAGGGAYKVAK